MFRYRSTEPVFEILRKAKASLETLNVVENALLERRPVMDILDLSNEQVPFI